MRPVALPIRMNAHSRSSIYPTTRDEGDGSTDRHKIGGRRGSLTRARSTGGPFFLHRPRVIGPTRVRSVRESPPRAGLFLSGRCSARVGH
jgi:hypothetical protein